MAFRLLRYAVAAMQRHLEQGNDTLPVVIPMLFYQSKIRHIPTVPIIWIVLLTRNWQSPFIMQAIPLVDVTAIPDEEIVTHRHVALMELVMKHIRTRDMLELSHEIASLLNQWVLQPELFRELICYIVERGNTADAKQFLHQIAERATDYREVVMTIAEQLRQEGEKQGIEKGIHLGEQRGIEKGRQESARSIAHQLLANGVDRAILKMFTELSDAEINALMD